MNLSPREGWRHLFEPAFAETATCRQARSGMCGWLASADLPTAGSPTLPRLSGQDKPKPK
ncbi:MAG: hypothetical protein KF803_06985 [Cyclobacteriaceae bacterium]|nr:hypothetical protein [Cyclobacteriaceae bacterium]